MRSFKMVGLLVMGLAVCGFVLAVPGAGLCGSNKNIVTELKKIKNDDNPFQIQLKTKDGKKEYKVGDTVTFTFRTDHDCYVYLIDVGTSGSVHVLFPSEKLEDELGEKVKHKAVAGETYSIPNENSKFVFRVSGPPGTNFVKAIGTYKPMKALDSELSKAQGDFAKLEKPTVAFKGINVELKKDKKKWAETELSFKVVE